MIYLHSAWVARAGIGDIVRHFTLRGFDISNPVGSRFYQVKPKDPVIGLKPNSFWERRRG